MQFQLSPAGVISILIRSPAHISNLTLVYLSLQTAQSLNEKCGLPPIPNAGAAAGAETGLAGIPNETATPRPAAVVPPVIRAGGNQNLAGTPTAPDAAGVIAAAEGKAKGEALCVWSDCTLLILLHISCYYVSSEWGIKCNIIKAFDFCATICRSRSCC